MQISKHAYICGRCLFPTFYLMINIIFEGFKLPHFTLQRIKRKKLSQFRISAHKLEIEQGRYTIPKTPVTSRICKQCDLNLVENEIHFLVMCPKYTHLRSKLYNKINNKNFNNLPDLNKFNWLMSMEDIRLTRELAVYLINCFQARTR